MAVDFQLVGHLVWSTEIIRSLFFFFGSAKTLCSFWCNVRKGGVSIKASGCSCPKLFMLMNLASRPLVIKDLHQ